MVPLQLSVAVTKLISGGGTGALQISAGGGGQVMVGGGVSTVLVMICVQVAVLPQASVAL